MSLKRYFGFINKKSYIFHKIQLSEIKEKNRPLVNSNKPFFKPHRLIKNSKPEKGTSIALNIRERFHNWARK